MIFSRLDADGKLALPSDFLEFLGLEPGDEVRLELKDGRIWIEDAKADDMDTQIQAAIDEYLADPNEETVSAEEAFERVRARINAMPEGRNVA